MFISSIFDKMKNNNRDGMILAFTFAVLILMSLMGVIILSNTRTELSISGNNRVNREAFNAADTAARVTVLMGRILLHPELGVNLNAILRESTDPKYPIEIEINGTRMTLAALESDAANPTYDYANRYVETIGTDPAAAEPHLVFKINDRVVATAVLVLESDNPVAAGMSLEQGGGVQVTIVSTVRGVPVVDIATPDDIEPQSIITTMYRDYLESTQ
jgi:hypothetical protein